jgi:hypothetical protein
MNNLEGERFISAHGYRGFKAWSAGSIAFRLVKQNIMAGSMQLFTS